jgi:hypothetical protein
MGAFANLDKISLDDQAKFYCGKAMDLDPSDEDIKRLISVTERLI